MRVCAKRPRPTPMRLGGMLAPSLAETPGWLEMRDLVSMQLSAGHRILFVYLECNGRNKDERISKKNSTTVVFVE